MLSSIGDGALLAANRQSGGLALDQPDGEITALKYSSVPAPLDQAGNFRIQSKLLDAANISTLPQPCENPLLLVRAYGAAGPVGWFAAGILDSGDDD